MIAIKLYDGTIIYARDFKIGHSAIFVENFKYKKNEEDSIYVEDAMTVHLDAIERHLIIHTGGKNEEVSENRDGAPSST